MAAGGGGAAVEGERGFRSGRREVGRLVVVLAVEVGSVGTGVGGSASCSGGVRASERKPRLPS
jgi:hypothetical protein